MATICMGSYREGIRECLEILKQERTRLIKIGLGNKADDISHLMKLIKNLMED